MKSVNNRLRRFFGRKRNEADRELDIKIESQNHADIWIYVSSRAYLSARVRVQGQIFADLAELS